MPFPASLLGAHVERRACPCAMRAEVLFFQRHAEIGQVGSAAGVDEDVGRFHVAMDHPVQMGVVQGFGNRRH